MFSARDVTVVIPSGPRWDRAHVLERTLDGLARQTVSGFDVIVVVDGTTAPPAGISRRVDVGDLTILGRPHDGPGPRRNAGARASKRPIVLLLGDDTIPLPTLVALHVARHAAHPEPETAVLGRVDWHPDSQRGRVQRWLEWSSTQFDYDRIVGEEAGWGRFYSSNLSIKREFLLDVGGFDESFTFGYEDTELGLRLDAKGLRLLYEPSARALHAHRYAWTALERRFELVGAGEQRMTDKHPGFPPYFLDRVLNRRRAPRWAPWPWLVELVPRSPVGRGGDDRSGAGVVPRLRHELEIRADAWYYARLTSAFLSGWTAGAAEAEWRAFAAGEYKTAVSDTQAARSDEGKAGPSDRRAGQYLAELRRAVAPGGRLLDSGDDAGAYGIPLLAEGYRVSFIRSSAEDAAFLRWRLARRGLDAPVHVGLDAPDELRPALDVREPFDAAYAFGAVERASQPVVRLAHLERLARLVAVSVPAGAALHRALRGGGNHSGRRGRLLRHRRLGDRHLALYRPGPVTRREAVWSSLERAVGRHLPPSKPWTLDPRW